LIVSEETGVISMAENGILTRFLDGKAVEKKLLSLYFEGETEVKLSERISRAIKGGKNVKK
jgi:diadenylate cyclase